MMHSRLVTFAALAFSSTLLPAQSPESGGAAGQSGVSVSVGVGRGAMGLTCSACAKQLADSRAAWLARVGIAKTPQLVFGVEVWRWHTTDAGPVVDFERTHMWYDLSLQYYPALMGRWRGLYLKGAVGLATLAVNPAGIDIRTFGGGAGIGFDIPVLSDLSLTPYFDLLASRKGENRYTTTGRSGRLEEVSRMFRSTMTTFGIAVRLTALP